jgi:hypothetical protein
LLRRMVIVLLHDGIEMPFSFLEPIFQTLSSVRV